MRLVLTDMAIQKLQYTGKQITYWDRLLPAFGVRVSPKSKAYVVMYGKRRQLKTLGRYGDLPLKAARIAAIEFLSQDPDSPSKNAPELILGFLEDARRRVKPDTANQYEQYLNALNLEGPVDEITKPDINRKLELYDGKPWAQNYAYATLRGFLNWCLDNGHLQSHPLQRGRPPNKTLSRERVLTDKEMARVWRATEDTTYGRMIRLLILTGQRRMEVRNLQPEDIADGLITFHTKGDNINILPVTPLVEENLYLPFSFNNWNQSLSRLKGECRVDFQHHDLRRTLATKMAQLGVNDIVIERVLGHTIQNVKHTYNRYSYLPEVKDALLKYEEHIRKIIRA